jgi:methylated-DNA-[protein]-cysteine S-methyltransferase
MSYGQVAARVGRPRAAQAVGQVMAANHDPRVPCHRVVAADGRLGGYNRGARAKRRRLADEGVTFIGPRINPSHFVST